MTADNQFLERGAAILPDDMTLRETVALAKFVAGFSYLQK